jgi:hypothetical protein
LSTNRHTVRRLLFEAGLVLAAIAVLGNKRPPAAPEKRPATPEAPKPARPRSSEAGEVTVRRLAMVFSFAVLFFTGAAFSAGAGDVVADVLQTVESGATSDSTSSEATTEAATPTEPVPEEPPAPAPAPAPEPEPAPAPEPQPAPEPAPAPDPVEAPVSQPEPSPAPAPSPAPGANPVAEFPADSPTGAPEGIGASVSSPTAPPVIISETRGSSRAPELEGPSEYATIWLHRALPDPTPAARRLAPAFAAQLRATANQTGMAWDYILAVVRARGATGRVPATAAQLDVLAARLGLLRQTHDRWGAVYVLTGSRIVADRTLALSRYNRAVGLQALVTGLEAAKSRLAARILTDGRISVYASGRADLASGRIDVRVLVLVRYLRVTFGQVTVSSLRTGHRFFARPGIPSAHVFGLAVDVSALDGVPVQGNQQEGGLVDRAVNAILLLPAEVQPQQVISLLGLGGRSFPAADHYDHIHVGY